ncbi:MAG: hypothetical protein JW884_06325, partial [Deltaproteobacteria bacterium]|nr:hypothetical protein [Deltaproteobacteria bacterium]
MNIRFSAMRRIVPVLKKDDGFVLVTALLLLALLIMVGTTTLFQTSTEMKISSNYMTKRQSLFDADAGAQYIIKKLKQDIAAGTLSLTGNSIALNYARPNGFAFDPPATLNSLGGDRYSFQVTGHGDNNSLSAIEMVLQLQQSSGHFRYGVFGDQGMNFVGSRVLDSYNSNNGPYGIANSFSNCDIGTNSTQPQGGSNVNPIGIDIGSNVTIRGDGFCGPGGNPADVISVSGILTGSRQAAPSAM